MNSITTSGAIYAYIHNRFTGTTANQGLLIDIVKNQSLTIDIIQNQTLTIDIVKNQSLTIDIVKNQSLTINVVKNQSLTIDIDTSMGSLQLFSNLCSQNMKCIIVSFIPVNKQK